MSLLPSPIFRALSAWLMAICVAAGDDRSIVAPAKTIGAQPLVTLPILGKSTPLLVDTGSSAPLVLFPGTVAGKAGDTIAMELRVTSGGRSLLSSAPILPARIPGARGILGWPVLKHSIWKLDLPNASHEFLAVVPDMAKGWPSFPIVAARESLAILHPKFGEVFLDSGARRGVCLSPARWAAWRKSVPDAALTLAEGFSPSSPGGSFANLVAYGASFQLPPVMLKQTNVGESFFDPGRDGASTLLGLEALAGVTMIVDGPGGRVYFQENPRPTKYRGTEPNRLQAAFLPDPAGTNANCAHVMPGGAGAQAGLQNGDIILSLNGSGLPPTFEELFQLVRHSGSKATFRLRRQGQILQLSLVVP